jgi:hypothetical protein
MRSLQETKSRYCNKKNYSPAVKKSVASSAALAVLILCYIKADGIKAYIPEEVFMIWVQYIMSATVENHGILPGHIMSLVANNAPHVVRINIMHLHA